MALSVQVDALALVLALVDLLAALAEVHVLLDAVLGVQVVVPEDVLVDVMELAQGLVEMAAPQLVRLIAQDAPDAQVVVPDALAVARIVVVEVVDLVPEAARTLVPEAVDLAVVEDVDLRAQVDVMGAEQDAKEVVLDVLLVALVVLDATLAVHLVRAVVPLVMDVASLDAKDALLAAEILVKVVREAVLEAAMEVVEVLAEVVLRLVIHAKAVVRGVQAIALALVALDVVQIALVDVKMLVQEGVQEIVLEVVAPIVLQDAA